MPCCCVLQGHSKDHPYVEVWRKLSGESTHCHKPPPRKSRQCGLADKPGISAAGPQSVCFDKSVHYLVLLPVILFIISS